MAEYVKITNLKGPKGDKGDKGGVGPAGAIAELHAHTISAGEAAHAEMSGPETSRRVDLYIPQGQAAPDALPAQTAIADYIASDVSEVGQAVMARVRSRQVFIDVRDFGAIGDGVADDTDAIQAAMDEADASSFAGRDVAVLLPHGTFRVTSGLHTMSSIDGAQALINFEGTSGAVITVGETIKVISRRDFYLPRIVCTVNKAAKAWSTPGIVGVRLVNLNTCQVYSTFIQHFDEGMVMEGNQQGFVHCEIHPGALWGNRRGLVLRPVNGLSNIGWVNSNNIYAGRLSAQATPAQTAGAWGIPEDPDAALIWMEQDTSGSQITSPNSNTFFGTSVEGPNSSLYRLVIGGRYNKFINCRFEHAPAEPYRIRYLSSAAYNHIDGGYSTDNIQEVFDAGSVANRLTLPQTNLNWRAWQVAALAVPAGNVRVPINTWGSVFGLGATYNAATGEVKPRQGRWRFEAQVNVSATSSGTGYVELTLMVNGVVRSAARQALSSSTFTALNVAWTQNFTTGNDLVQFGIATTSPTGVSLVTSPYYCTFHGEYIG